MDSDLLNQIPEPLRSKISAAFSSLEQRNRLLSEQLRLLRLKKYGASAERLSDLQLSLLEAEPVVTPGEVEREAALPEALKSTALKPADKKPVRAPLPADLPRERRIIALSPEQCVCAQCGGEKKLIDYEKSERINVRPAIYYVLETLREKRACPRCEELGVSVAPVPASIVEKGILGDGLVIDVILAKFADHTPLYRQAAAIQRDAGVSVSQSTLGSATLKAGELLEPVCAAMRLDLLAGGFIQADETPVPVRSEATQGRNHTGFVWEYGRPGGPVVYNFRMGREREGPRKFLGGFGGKLQSDGYAAYDKIGGPGLVHFGCWAHVRRKFCDALKLDPKDAQSTAILARISQLYAVESEAREAGHEAPMREALRGQRSVGLLEEIKAAILSARTAALPQSALGKACAYALDQWPRLERFAREGNGIVEIDNNWAENGMRGIALGRKNWLHVGSEAAGPKIAALYSVLETCKRLKINPRDYLGDVLPRIADWNSSRIGELTPMTWQQTRTQQPA